MPKRRGRPPGSKNKPKPKPAELPPLPVEPAEMECAAPEPEPEPSTPATANLDHLRSVLFNLDPLDLLRRKYRVFADFLPVVWRAAIPGSPDPTRLQLDIADYIQNGPLLRMVLAFRGVGKSYIAAAYAAHLFFHDEEERIKLLSGSDKKANEFSTWARSLIRNEQLVMLHHLEPGRHQRDSQSDWDVGPSTPQQSPSFSATTVNSAIQGGRGSLIVWDDCEQKTNCETPLMRDKILKRETDTANMLIPERNRGILCLGTYQVMASTYDVLVRERGFDVLYVPSEVPRDMRDYGGHLAPSIAARAADPSQIGMPTETRFSRAYLDDIKRTIGPLQYQLEWMMSTAHGDRHEHPFPMDRLVVWDCHPFHAPAKIIQANGEDCRIMDLPFLGLPGDGFYRPSFVDLDSPLIPYQHILMAVDPAGSASEDECAYVILGAVFGQIHILGFGGFKNGVDPKTMKGLVAAARNAKVHELVYESNLQSWGSLFEQHLKDPKEGYPVKLTPIHTHTTNKNLRIVQTLEPVLHAGCLIASKKAIRQEYDDMMRSGVDRWKEKTLQFQMAMFRRSAKDSALAYDDRIDALALGVAQLHERYLKTSTAAAAEANQDRLDWEHYERWNEDTWGDKVQEPVWVTTRR